MDYLPEVDRRVLVYRRLAAATEAFDVDRLQQDTESNFSALPHFGKFRLIIARAHPRAAFGVQRR